MRVHTHQQHSALKTQGKFLMRQIWCCHRFFRYPKPYRHQTWPYYQKRLGRETLSWHVMNAACRGKAFSSWLFSYALLCLDLVSEASEEDRLQLRFLCNTLPGGLSNNQHDVCRWEEREVGRGGLLGQMRERARGRLRKAMTCSGSPGRSTEWWNTFT